MGELKPGWTRVKFGDVVRLNRETSKAPRSDGLERYVGLEHIEPGDLRVRSWGDIADGTTFTNRFRPGLVLFGKRRAYQRKVAVADFDGVCSGDIYVLESKNQTALVPELLPFICQTEAFFEHAVGTSAGSLSPRTNWKSLATYEFALPPIEHQSGLIRLLDAARAMFEATEFLRDSAIMTLHAMRDEAYRQAKFAGQMVRLENLMTEGRPIRYGILMPGTGHPGGVPVIKVKDFPEGKILDDDLLLTPPEVDEQYKRSRLLAGDLLVSIRGTIGRVARIPAHLSGANITQDSARFSFDETHNRHFMRAMLECSEVQRRMLSNVPPPAIPGRPRQKAKPRPSIQGVNIGALRRIKVPVPERTMQDQLADATEQLRDAVESAEARLHEAQDAKAAILRVALGGSE